MDNNPLSYPMIISPFVLQGMGFHDPIHNHLGIPFTRRSCTACPMQRLNGEQGELSDENRWDLGEEYILIIVL